MKFSATILAFISLAAVTGALFAGYGTQMPPPAPQSGAMHGPIPSQGLTVYDTPYYVIHTDLDRADAREATIRMTKMAEEYLRRTKSFSGPIRQKLPFYLYRDEQEYYSAGGIKGSAGLFDGNELLAIAGEHPDAATWHTVQHEGFHQFASAVVGELPVWVNEGIAEYFGEAIFTGDSFVSGVIPPWRLKRVKEEIRSGAFKPIGDIMQMPHDQWNDGLSIANYDQAWSMVQFLAHGDDGKYADAFSAFMVQLGHGHAWEQAWRQTFGDTAGFEQRWKQWWLNLPDDPTAARYAYATTSTLTSYLGRAFSQRQTFPDFAAFAAAGRAGKLKYAEADWLPKSLIVSALDDVEKRADEGDHWTIELAARSRQPQIVCTMGDGTRLVGQFALAQGRVAAVSVTEEKPKAAGAANDPAKPSRPLR